MIDNQRRLQGPGRRGGTRKGGKKKATLNYGHADSSRELTPNIHNSFSPTTKDLTGTSILSPDRSPSPFSIESNNSSNSNTNTNNSNNNITAINTNNTNTNVNTNTNQKDTDLIIKDEQLRKPSEIRKVKIYSINK